MMGLYQAGRVDKGYHTAFVLSVVARVSGLLCRLIGVPDLLGYILEFAVVYLVCTKTARRLEAEGDLSTAARGRFVWKLDAACLAVTLLSGLLLQCIYGLRHGSQPCLFSASLPKLLE